MTFQQRIVAANGVVAIGVSVAWMVLDFCLVTSSNYPQNCDRSFWWFYAPIPVVFMIGNLCCLKRLPLVKRAAINLVITVVMCSALWVAMRQIGVRFHHLIGGM